jgi:hypothetical protein
MERRPCAPSAIAELFYAQHLEVIEIGAVPLDGSSRHCNNLEIVEAETGAGHLEVVAMTAASIERNGPDLDDFEVLRVEELCYGTLMHRSLLLEHST